MNPALQKTMLRPSPFLGPRGGVDMKGLCDLLQFDHSTLATTLRVSRQAVSQQLQRKKRFVQPRTTVARKFWEELNEVIALLLALTDGQAAEDEIRLWLRSPNKALGYKRPIDLIKRRQLGPLKEALMDALTAAHGG